MKRSVIIVAGGKGLRMGAELPKQFIPVGGKPILMHTIEAFYRYDSSIHIILVLPKSHQSYWFEICHNCNFKVPCTIANGGNTRFDSVKNGLEKIDSGLVAVHDGVRPLISADLIERSFQNANEKKAVIPVIDSVDSLREVIDESHSRIIDRNQIKAIQTPQVFDYEIISKAYEQNFEESFTDDASVVEALGYQITLIEGERSNIKVTTPFDLKICECLIQNR